MAGGARAPHFRGLTWQAHEKIFRSGPYTQRGLGSFMMFDDDQGGVIVADGRCGVRLRVSGPPVDHWRPMLIEVRAGPFSGSILDEIRMDFQSFGRQLAALYASLSGQASFGGEEKFSLKLVGDGRGGVKAFADIKAFDSTVRLSFEIQLDQTYLPAIIEALQRES